MIDLQKVTRVLAMLVAVAATVLASFVVASPANAAARTLVQATFSWCLRDSGGGIANVDLKSCKTKPAINNTWSFISKGKYNNHQLYTFKNAKTARCVDNVRGGRRGQRPAHARLRRARW